LNSLFLKISQILIIYSSYFYHLPCGSELLNILGKISLEFIEFFIDIMFENVPSENQFVPENSKSI